MNFSYKPKNVCPVEIKFDIDGNIVTNIEFKGGCNGNLKAISKLVDGWSVDEISSKLSGNTCGGRATSCADQLACAVKAAYNAQKN